jgi:hypothetical protein
MESKALHILGGFLVDELRKELAEQGHNTSKMTLSDSIRYEIVGNDLFFYARDYAKYVDSGRAKEVKRIPIDALAQWVELRGIATGESEIKSMAYAIQTKIYQEGSPTLGSFAFSDNGRRTDFVKFTFEENAKVITELALEAMGEKLLLNFINQMEITRKQWQQL